MEKLKYYTPNFDFELGLENKKNKYINDSLEFLFFWVSAPNDVLVTNNSYSQDYLKYIHEKINIIPQFSSNNPEAALIHEWWGDSKDLVRAKLLNSNWEFHQWLYKNNHHHEKIQFYELFNEDYYADFYYKKEFGFSGKSFLKKEIGPQEKIIKMPKLNKIDDYSIVYTDDKKYVFLKHQINKDLAWSGVEQTNETNLKMLELFKKWQKYFNAYDPASLDFFSYEKSKEILVFPSEINYRKTMGSVFIELTKRIKGYNKMVMTNKILKKGENILLSPLKTNAKYNFYLC